MTMMAAPTLGSLCAQERRAKPNTLPAPRSSMLTGSRLQTFSCGEIVVEVTGPPQEWVAPTLDSLRRLMEMPSGWDSYGARRIVPANVMAAIEVAFAVMNENTPAPTVVPTSAGGIQFEWHTRGIDLEIEIRSPSRISACFEDQRTNEAWDVEQLYDYGRLRDALRNLAKR